MDNYQALITKVEKVVNKHQLDLSSGEDLSVAVMNLIGIEEHLFFTYNKTKDKKYIDLLDEIRRMRIELMKELIKDYEGEVYCISKHLLAASMRLMEVGTKELKKGNKEKAKDLFEKSYKLYSLFWGLNTKMVNLGEVKRDIKDVYLIDDKSTGPEPGEGKKFEKVSIFNKLNVFIQKALDCCRE